MIERISRDLGMSLLFSEHDMAAGFSIAERITLLHQGRIVADGAPEAVRRNPAAVAAYLGEAE